MWCHVRMDARTPHALGKTAWMHFVVGSTRYSLGARLVLYHFFRCGPTEHQTHIHQDFPVETRRGTTIVGFKLLCGHMAVGQNRYPKWNSCKRKHGQKAAVHWWFHFDPQPHAQAEEEVPFLSRLELPGLWEPPEVLDLLREQRFKAAEDLVRSGEARLGPFSLFFSGRRGLIWDCLMLKPPLGWYFWRGNQQEAITKRRISIK